MARPSKLVRLHRNIGGFSGWFALLVGLTIMTTGIIVLLGGMNIISLNIPQLFGLKHPPLIYMGIAGIAIGSLLNLIVISLPIIHYFVSKSAETQANATIRQMDDRLRTRKPQTSRVVLHSASTKQKYGTSDWSSSESSEEKKSTKNDRASRVNP